MNPASIHSAGECRTVLFVRVEAIAVEREPAAPEEVHDSFSVLDLCPELFDEWQRSTRRLYTCYGEAGSDTMELNLSSFAHGDSDCALGRFRL